jgi:KaiC/GvpD/RAD55 family RecA-like ATPase
MRSIMSGSSPEASSSKAPARAPTTGAAARSEAIPTEHDLAQAREDSLLQLRIGRTAHYYAVLVFAALILDGFLILAIDPLSAGASTLTGLYFLLAPLGGALLIAFFGLAVKWDAYQIWPWELHFWLTVLAVPLAGTLGYLLVAVLVHVGATAGWALLPWFLSAEFAVLSVAIVGLTLTWQEWTGRKTAAVLAALLPVPLAVSLWFAPWSGEAAALALVLVAAGGLYLASASFLHLISSGTHAHEREVIISGQSRLFRFSEDLRGREDALRSREATLLRREADVEVGESAVARKLAAQNDVREKLQLLERDLETRANRVHADFAAAALKIAEATHIQRELSAREGELKLREEEVLRWEGRRQERDLKLTAAEAELVRRQLEIGNLEKELLERRNAVAIEAANASAQRAELDRRERDISSQEQTARAGAKVASSNALAAREAQLLERERTLELRSATFAERETELEERTQALRTERSAQAAREATLLTREHALEREREELLSQRKDVDSARATYQRELQRLEARGRELDEREAALAGRADEIEQRSEATRRREEVLARDRRELDSWRSEVEARERAQIARTSELGPTSPAAPSAPIAATAPPPLAPVSATPALLPRTERVGRSVLSREERVPTGIPRLDDLLLGGFPERAQVMLIGPPFLGEETLLYGFLAEGLTHGETVVLVTTVRPPADLAREMGPLLPQLEQYEAMGRVRWIDASNPAAKPPSPTAPAASRILVRGPADHAGILRALTSLLAGAEGSEPPRRVRVGMISLSTLLQQGDPKGTFGFLQQLVGLLRERSSIGLYLVDPGTVEDAEVRSALQRMDGALTFQQDRGRTVLSVTGLGEVATRDPVDYRVVGNSLVLGSFALERIR